jgi:predicted TIM-barrel enzyme
MLAARRKHQQRLGFRVQVLAAFEDHSAQLFAGRRAARLARDLDAQAAASQKTGDPPDMGALARAVDAFKRYELAAHQRRPDR